MRRWRPSRPFGRGGSRDPHGSVEGLGDLLVRQLEDQEGVPRLGQRLAAAQRVAEAGELVLLELEALLVAEGLVRGFEAEQPLEEILIVPLLRRVPRAPGVRVDLLELGDADDPESALEDGGPLPGDPQ